MSCNLHVRGLTSIVYCVFPAILRILELDHIFFIVISFLLFLCIAVHGYLVSTAVCSGILSDVRLSVLNDRSRCEYKSGQTTLNTVVDNNAQCRGRKPNVIGASKMFVKLDLEDSLISPNTPWLIRSTPLCNTV